LSSAADLYTQRFGGSPDGVWAAPGRVNLIGEHTDYNDGLVLPFALAERTEAAIGLRGDSRIRICSAQTPGELIKIDVSDLAPRRPAGWPSYVAGVPWALDATTGFDVAIESQVPVGSGLSSSAALICAVGLGLNELLELGLGRRELARRGHRTENDYVGAPTGRMDQIASLLCTEGHALLYDVQADTTEQIPFDPGAAGLDVVVVDTTVRHGHAGGEYADRRADCEESAYILGVDTLRDVGIADLAKELPKLGDGRLIRRTRHIVTENQRVLDTAAALCDGRWSDVGELLTAAHASIRDDFDASCPELDAAVETLVASGALGARMTGGGFGGAAIALLPHGQSDIARREINTVFAGNGFAHPHMFSVVPSAGARRIT